MNVCLLTYQSVSLLRGGPRTQILQTRKCLEDLGCKVSLFDPWTEFTPADADIVHLFGANIGTYHIARQLHRTGVPLVVSPIFYTRHSHSFVNSMLLVDSVLRKVTRGVWSDFGLIDEICRWSRLVIANTKAESDLFTGGFKIPAESIVVVPNGVEERFYHASPRLFQETYGVRDFILNVGHIGPARKNILRLIQALHEIEAPAVIIGRYEETEEGRRCMAEARRNERLRVLEPIPHDSELLASAYAASSVFALPSWYETPGIAALEAALAGARIVITDRGGTTEYFGTHATYVDYRSVKSIRDGIRTALERTQEGILREEIRTRFLWTHVAERLREVYSRVLA